MVQFIKVRDCNNIKNIQCESKKVAPLKLFAVFSLLVNLCNSKLPWLLPKHIPISTPILVHLSEYLCEMYHFYRRYPSNFTNSIQFVTKFMNFSLKHIHIK